MARYTGSFADSVFINCPFDGQYRPLFDAIVFCVIDCGFVPRCALEDADSGQVRLHKICRLIRGSRFAIHDISRVELSEQSALPRFNMPFELGLDMGARTYGSAMLRRKRILVLDAAPYRYRASISDIAGHDVQYHGNSTTQVIEVVRHWLRIVSHRETIPPAATIEAHFRGFTEVLPTLDGGARRERGTSQFLEYVYWAAVWLTITTGGANV